MRVPFRELISLLITYLLNPPPSPSRVLGGGLRNARCQAPEGLRGGSGDLATWSVVMFQGVYGFKVEGLG